MTKIQLTQSQIDELGGLLGERITIVSEGDFTESERRSELDKLTRIAKKLNGVSN